MRAATLVRYLFGDLDAARAIAADPWRAIGVGLLFVCSAMIAREYDGEYLPAEPIHIALPFLGGLGGALASGSLLYGVSRLRGGSTPGYVTMLARWTALFLFMAPLAWLYGDASASPTKRHRRVSVGERIARMRHVTIALLVLVAPVIALAAPDDLPETPGRGAIVEAMRYIVPRVAACGEAHGQHGTVSISFVFDSNGAATEVHVAPQYDGTPIGACFAAAAASAQVPPFSRPTFRVNYPFRY